MKERAVLVRADYGHVELKLKEVMDARGITRNQLAKLIDARFEVVGKWISLPVSVMRWIVRRRISFSIFPVRKNKKRYSIEYLFF